MIPEAARSREDVQVPTPFALSVVREANEVEATACDP